MERSAGAGDYEVVVVGEAKRVIRELERDEQELLAAALRSELRDSPAPNVVVVEGVFPHRIPEEHTYFATVLLSYVIVYRRMTDEELEQLGERAWRPLARQRSQGFAVFDIVLALPD